VATELNAIKPNSAIFAQCDVTQRASIENAVNTASKSFGRFDIMVNNAGIAFPTEDFVLESTEKWKKVVDINMMGVFYGTQIAIQELKKNDKGGLIINTASAAGIYPQYHAPIYAATKAAVVHLTRSLKNLQKDFNIRVVAVCPTYTVTPLITTHGPDVLKFMESQSGGLMTTDDVINVFVELTFDLKKKGGGAVFEVSPQIKDYWPRRSGPATALAVGGKHAASHSNTGYSSRNTTSTGSDNTKPSHNNTGASAGDKSVARPKHIVEENGDKPLYYQKEAARTKVSKL
jgi:NAD(P)-dependent dehydrogenase (short-subunit alcohol dehydrogenase family)